MAGAGCSAASLADGGGDRRPGGVVLLRGAAGGGSGIALRSAAGPAEGPAGLGHRPGRRTVQRSGALGGLLFCHVLWPGAAADLYGAGDSGRRGAVFLPAEPAAASAVGLLAGQSAADPARPADAWCTGGPCAEKIWAKMQKGLSFLEKVVYNNRHTLARDADGAPAGGEARDAR